MSKEAGTVDGVPRAWLLALEEHYAAEADYFEHEGEEDTEQEWRAKADEVCDFLRIGSRPTARLGEVG